MISGPSSVCARVGAENDGQCILTCGGVSETVPGVLYFCFDLRSVNASRYDDGVACAANGTDHLTSFCGRASESSVKIIYPRDPCCRIGMGLGTIYAENPLWCTICTRIFGRFRTERGDRRDPGHSWGVGLIV